MDPTNVALASTVVLDPVDLATIVALLGAACSAAYWGGQMKRSVDTLCERVGDHEDRLRANEERLAALEVVESE